LKSDLKRYCSNAIEQRSTFTVERFTSSLLGSFILSTGNKAYFFLGYLAMDLNSFVLGLIIIKASNRTGLIVL